MSEWALSRKRLTVLKTGWDGMGWDEGRGGEGKGKDRVEYIMSDGMKIPLSPSVHHPSPSSL